MGMESGCDALEELIATMVFTAFNMLQFCLWDMRLRNGKCFEKALSSNGILETFEGNVRGGKVKPQKYQFLVILR